MKKLLLLALVMLGGVVNVSATDITVYFKPDLATWGGDYAKFKLVTAEDGEGKTTAGVAMSAVDGVSNVYSAVLDNSSVTKFKFARMSSDGNTEWNKHDTWTTLEANKYYVMNGLYDNNYSKLNLTKRDLSQTWSIVGGRHITKGFAEWSTSSTDLTANALSTVGNISQTLSISKRPLKAGTYEFKFYGDDWCGTDVGISNSDYNYELVISTDGVYDITYSFNQLSRAGSVSAVKDDGDTDPIDYKYYLSDENKSITGNSWSSNLMTTSSANTVSYTANNVNLINGTTYRYKVIEKITKGSSDVNTYTPSDWWSISIDKTRAYNVTVSFVKNANYKMSASNPSAEKSDVTSGYYFIQNPGSGWTVGDRLTEVETNVWTGTISNMPNGYFAILPATSLGSGDTDFKWTGVVRPSAATDGNPQAVNFEIYSNEAVEDHGGVWRIASTNDAAIKVTYNQSTSKWSIQPYYTTTIGDAGYATWSNDGKYQIDNTNVTDVYVVSANHTSTVTLTSVKGYTFPAGEGVIIKGSGTVTINAVASDATPATITTNYLVGSGNSSTTPATGDNYYVFSWEGTPATVGFYKASGGTLAAHKAYLNLGAGEARGFLGFDFDETTGISNLTPAFNEGAVYDMQGRRVMNPSKGLYIINGKKVIK